jgi:hypothetical protein
MATLATLTMMNKTAPPDQLTEPHVIADKLSTFEYLSKDFRTSLAYVQECAGTAALLLVLHRVNGALSPCAMDLRVQ